MQTKADRYACSNLADLTARLEGYKIFTKLDLHKGIIKSLCGPKMWRKQR